MLHVGYNQSLVSEDVHGHHVLSSEHLAQRAEHSCLAGIRGKVQSIECTLERAQFQHPISHVCHLADCIGEED